MIKLARKGGDKCRSPRPFSLDSRGQGRDNICAGWSDFENGQRMGGTRIFLPLTLGIAVLGLGSVFANPAFNSSEIEGQGSELIFCDLDGDNLQDAVLVDGPKLSIFFQDPRG